MVGFLLGDGHALRRRAGQGCPVSRVLHGGNDGLRPGGRRVIVHGHGVCEQVHRAGCHAVHMVHGLLHMGLTRRAGHAGYIKFLSFQIHRNTPLSIGNDTCTPFVSFRGGRQPDMGIRSLFPGSTSHMRGCGMPRRCAPRNDRNVQHRMDFNGQGPACVSARCPPPAGAPPPEGEALRRIPVFL